MKQREYGLSSKRYAVIDLDAQRREQEAVARERELQERINQLQRELGKTEGELAAYKALQQATPPPERSKSWWARLLGIE